MRHHATMRMGFITLRARGACALPHCHARMLHHAVMLTAKGAFNPTGKGLGAHGPAPAPAVHHSVLSCNMPMCRPHEPYGNVIYDNSQKLLLQGAPFLCWGNSYARVQGNVQVNFEELAPMFQGDPHVDSGPVRAQATRAVAGPHKTKICPSKCKEYGDSSLGKSRRVMPGIMAVAWRQGRLAWRQGVP